MIEAAKKRLAKFSFSGRRVVELGIIAKGLSKCIGCPKPLELSDCSGETILGLASVLRITCNLCGMVNNIPTCKYRSVGKEAKLPPETKLNRRFYVRVYRQNISLYFIKIGIHLYMYRNGYRYRIKIISRTQYIWSILVKLYFSEISYTCQNK